MSPFTLALLLLPFLPLYGGSETFAAPSASQEQNSDIARVALIATEQYDPRVEQGRGLKEFFSGLGVALAGPGMNLEREIAEKLRQPELQAYFPDSRERSRLAARLSNEVHARYLSRGYTNGNVLASLQYITDQLVTSVVARVLEKEGAKNEARNKAWAARILSPFDRCIRLARSYGEGKKCGQALEGDLLKNVGLALTYEMSRSSFGPAFAEPRLPEYKACLRLETPAADSRVRDCSLRSVRRAALGFGRVKLLETAKRSLPAAEANRLMELASPTYEKCLSSANDRAAFVACGDSLVRSAGPNLAEEAVARDARLSAMLPDPAERARAARAGHDAFLNCLTENSRHGRRDENGLLETASCENAVKREATLFVAEAKVRSALHGKIEDEAAVNRLVGLLVKKDFPDCLGSAPADEQLDRCTQKLAKNVAYQAAQNIVPAKVDEFFRKGGGLAAYGITGEERNRIVTAAIETQKQCLRKEAKSLDPAKTELEINDCFKRTVRALALDLGAIELTKSARENGMDPAGAPFKEASNTFRTDLGACLDRRREPQFGLDDYLKGLDLCQAEITRAYTAKLAKSELGGVIREVFADASAGVELGDRLGSELDTCLKSAANQTAAQACVARLKANATVELARAGVLSRAKKELGEDLPARLTDLEKRLDACLANGRTGEDCALDHVKDSTLALGSLLLDAKLKPELGERFGTLEPEIRKLEDPFRECVKGVKPPLNQALLNQLDDCGTKLTESALEFLLLHMGDAEPAAPTVPKASPLIRTQSLVGEGELADMMTRTFLCLNNSLTPENESSLQNVRPLTLEGELLKLVAAYVNYDIQNARGSYQEVLAQVAEELKAAGTEGARRKLLDELVKRGLVDQLMKSILRTEIEKNLQALPAARRLPAEVEKKLLDKAVIDRAFGEKEMGKIRPLMADGVLKPILVDGKSFLSLGVVRSFSQAKSLAVEALLASPEVAADESQRRQIRAAIR